MNLQIVQTAMSYWLGALSEPVLIIGRDDMAKAAADGAVIWDVRPRAEFERGHLDGALSLGEVAWLLADDGGGNLIPPAVIEDALATTGILQGRAVVIYSEQRAVDAFVALRALRSIGIADAQVCLGDAAAVAQARPETAAEAKPARMTAETAAELTPEITPEITPEKTPEMTAGIRKPRGAAVGPAARRPLRALGQPA